MLKLARKRAKIGLVNNMKFFRYFQNFWHFQSKKENNLKIQPQKRFTSDSAHIKAQFKLSTKQKIFNLLCLSENPWHHSFQQ